MERFKYKELPIHNYDAEYIQKLSDKELVDLLNKYDWDFDLLRDLLWRAHHDDPNWVKSEIPLDLRELKEAANILGQNLICEINPICEGGNKIA